VAAEPRQRVEEHAGDESGNPVAHSPEQLRGPTIRAARAAVQV